MIKLWYQERHTFWSNYILKSTLLGIRLNGGTYFHTVKNIEFTTHVHVAFKLWSNLVYSLTMHLHPQMEKTYQTLIRFIFIWNGSSIFNVALNNGRSYCSFHAYTQNTHLIWLAVRISYNPQTWLARSDPSGSSLQMLAGHHCCNTRIKFLRYTLNRKMSSNRKWKSQDYSQRFILQIKEMHSSRILHVSLEF